MSELNALYGGDGNPLARTAKPSTASTLGQLENELSRFTSGLAQLQSAGLSPEFIKGYLTAYGDVGFQTAYVTKSVELTWNRDKGIDVDIDGVNFVEVALDTASGFDDATLLPGAGAKPTQQTPPKGP